MQHLFHAVALALLAWPRLLGASAVPRPDFAGRVLHVCVATASYAHAVTLWAGSLATAGVPREDIYVHCLGVHCDALRGPDYRGQALGEEPARRCRQSPHGSSMSCHIAVAKGMALTSILRGGHAAVFYDTDVYVFAHPVARMRVNDPRADVFVSTDRFRGRQKDRYNFGFFLVYPGPGTLRLFEMYEAAFLLDPAAWDQTIFGRVLERLSAAGDLAVEALDPGPYAAVHLEVAARTFPPAREGLVTLHGTCIEGERVKELAVFSEYPRPWLPSEDMRLAESGRLMTVAVVVDGKPLVLRSAAEVDFVGRLLLKVARQVGGKVRLAHFESYQGVALPPYRLLSASAFEGAGIDLVEERFWDNFPARHVSRKIVSVGTATDLSGDVVRERVFGLFHEVLLSLDPDAFRDLVVRFQKGVILSDTESVMCGTVGTRVKLAAEAQCLHWCDGNGFRLEAPDAGKGIATG